jgi:hypothetical protein
MADKERTAIFSAQGTDGNVPGRIISVSQQLQLRRNNSSAACGNRARKYGIVGQSGNYTLDGVCRTDWYF